MKNNANFSPYISLFISLDPDLKPYIFTEIRFTGFWMGYKLFSVAVAPSHRLLCVCWPL